MDNIIRVRSTDQIQKNILNEYLYKEYSTGGLKKLTWISFDIKLSRIYPKFKEI
ncbi:MAG: hypothetical protein K9K32_05790 [Halanaerobiales bacterium]|nr:hypothetical protein [Halanaerobiales bacterium]